MKNMISKTNYIKYIIQYALVKDYDIKFIALSNLNGYENSYNITTADIILTCQKEFNFIPNTDELEMILSAKDQL